MSRQRVVSAAPDFGAAKIVTLGTLVASAIVSGSSLVGPTKSALAIAGLAMLLPALVLRRPREYGLVLLVLSFLVELQLRLTKWLADPWALFVQFGMPPSGTLSIDLYISDVILFALLVPWIVQLALRKRQFYFPKAAYVFLLFLAWCVVISLLEAPSLYLAAFELVRKLLYFLLFVYIVNNVETTEQFRAIMLALLAGLAFEAAIVIVFFFLGIGAETYMFRSVIEGTKSSTDPLGSLTVAEVGSWKNVKRSSGTFVHPSMAAYYFEYLLPIVLALFLAVRQTRYRILFAVLYLAGVSSLVLTFSRAAMVGFLAACAVFLPAARWAGLISQRVFGWFLAGAVVLSLVGAPVLVTYLMTRPEAYALRFRILDPALDAFAERPLWGGGLNNSTAVTAGSRSVKLLPTGHTEYTSSVVHNYHVVLLLDVGIFGYLLYTWFFVLICFNALRQLREATLEMKVLSVGIVSAFLGIWVHNLADPFGGHALQAMWWLEAGLIFAISRAVTTRKVSPVSKKRGTANFDHPGSGDPAPGRVLSGKMDDVRRAAE